MKLYRDANGRPLAGACRRKDCPNLSLVGIDVCPVHASPLERETFDTYPGTDKRGVVKRGCPICGSVCGVDGCRICEQRVPCSRHDQSAEA